jgi:sulfate adenylyltransferase subunit 1 (EFTu-like GTPase family)
MGHLDHKIDIESSANIAAGSLDFNEVAKYESTLTSGSSGIFINPIGLGRLILIDASINDTMAAGIIRDATFVRRKHFAWTLLRRHIHLEFLRLFDV